MNLKEGSKVEINIENGRIIINVKKITIDDIYGIAGKCFVGYFRIIQKFINNYTEYYPWERVSTRGIGTSTTRTL